VLEVRSGKDDRRRELPLSTQTQTLARRHRNSANVGTRESLVSHSTRTLGNWIEEARTTLNAEAAEELGMHDLRRTWATRSFYALAASGVPIAEELVMGWGGWKQNARGRETFRENYLGPVPDATADAVADALPLPDPS